MGQDDLDLGSEQEDRADLRVIERLHAEAVAGERQRPELAVPDRESEHAVEAQQGADAPGRESLEQNLRVAARHKGPAARRELRPQFLEVINLAVERQRIASVLGHHWLPPQRRQVDDGEPPVPERQRAVDELPFAVGATVADGVAHGGHADLRGRRAVAVQDARDTAHAGSGLRG